MRFPWRTPAGGVTSAQARDAGRQTRIPYPAALPAIPLRLYPQTEQRPWGTLTTLCGPDVPVAVDLTLPPLRLSDAIRRYPELVTLPYAPFLLFGGIVTLPIVQCLESHAPLSVQVHPVRDTAVPKHETWWPLRGSVTDGFRAGLIFSTTHTNALIDAAEYSYAEQLLQPHTVPLGSYLHIPAGTLHQLPAGARVLEVASAPGPTYRLQDAYGRPTQPWAVTCAATNPSPRLRPTTGPHRSPGYQVSQRTLPFFAPTMSVGHCPFPVILVSPDATEAYLVPTRAPFAWPQQWYRVAPSWA